MDDLYRENILEHYKRPRNWAPPKEIADADLEAEDFNPLCGDELKVQIKVGDDGLVEDIAFSGHGCAISQASASMASDEVDGLELHGPRDLAMRGSVISFALDGIHPHDVAEILGRDQICVRAGHHCAQVLMNKLGVAATARASFGPYNVAADVDALVAALDGARAVFGLD